MTETWTLAALWLGLALVAGLASIWLRVATALSEIVVGIAAGAALGTLAMGVDQEWVKFLAGAGAIVLTFLAGVELDPEVFRRKWKEATAVGLVSFFAPFLGCAAAARLGLEDRRAIRRPAGARRALIQEFVGLRPDKLLMQNRPHDNGSQ